MRVAFQGLRGAYSEAALRAHFGASAEPLGHPLSEQVFDAVEAGKADVGFVPVENSIAGPVGVNLDLLLERPVFAVAESYLPIRHCLLGRKGAAISDVRVVRSHPVALAQCREFLNKRKLTAIPEYDTAGAAELVAQRGLPDEGAIASRECAAVYGLDVLAEDVQSVSRNFTRFLAFVPAKKAPKAGKGGKTSLAFAVKHQPGALLDALKVFADRKINLTRLESRPIQDDPFQYVFLVDLLGGLADETVKSALKALGAHVRMTRVIGSYPVAERPFVSINGKRRK